MFLKSNDSPSHAAATATSALARGTFYRRISNEKRPRGRARCLSLLCVHHVYRHHCGRRDRCRFPGPRQSLTAVGDDKLTRLCIHLLFLSAVALSPSKIALAGRSRCQPVHLCGSDSHWSPLSGTAESPPPDLVPANLSPVSSSPDQQRPSSSDH